MAYRTALIPAPPASRRRTMLTISVAVPYAKLVWFGCLRRVGSQLQEPQENTDLERWWTETRKRLRREDRRGRDLGESSSSPSFLERIVEECLPLYRTITKVTVVSGTATSFWFDRWLPGEPLAKRFAALFSHCTRPQASVAVVAALGIDLQPWLSSVAEGELRLALQLLHATPLREGPDLRSMDTPAAPPFSTRAAYRLLSPVHPRDVSACCSWALRLPTKLRIFAYLADIDRLSTRANLFYKSCAPSDVCAACPQVETRRHLFFDCCLPSETWRCLGVRIPAGPSLCGISPLPIPTSLWHAGLATVLWGLWKARNDLVFNSRSATPALVLRKVCDDLALWRWRYRIEDRGHLDQLRVFFISCIRDV
ncbi:hypothetical protein QYE76_059380 [Lolium multiflorum]|uniref:Reverse transcriptase zinc-binding domain-containing protein n=1 Tax=Lolium multiflorum TaxID=4521 RepID=A0AAD8RXZ9_LOLMU|nr:hypothetical protein QYE76_059380 [Lolium multiflorum]